MRIFAITPIHVGPAELARRQQRYDRLAPTLTIELHDLPESAPAALETAELVRESERCVIAAVGAADLHGYDAVLPDCVLDPGVDRLSDTLAVPVYGLLRLCAGALAGTGRSFAAVARNQPIADELAARLRAYGLDRGFGGCDVLGVPVDAIADESSWSAALVRSVENLTARGATAVVNGCSAVDVDEALPLAASVIDPTATALTLLQAMAAAGVVPAATTESVTA